MLLRKSLLEKLGLDSASLLGEYLCFKSRRGIRILSGIRLTGRPRILQAELHFGFGGADRLEYLTTLLKLRDFFSGLQKRNIPCIYMVMLNPVLADAEEVVTERKQLELEKSNASALRRLEMGVETGFFQTEVLLLTWIDDKSKPNVEKLERHVDSLLSSLSAVFPEMEAVKLNGEELAKMMSRFFLPSQIGSNLLIAPEVITLANFILPTPSSASEVTEPEFSLPTAESVIGNDLFLGWVRRYGRNLYPISLRLHDLKAHCAIFGVTGSGKSTTASAITSRLVDIGVKVLVIDWHSEYRSLILEKGGLVFTPGRDTAPFTLNPLDPSVSEDLSEHICLVVDIFCDVFGLTHPQSFMLSECLRRAYRNSGYSSAPPPTISDLIREVERAPIRSAYDNETKLALLRRLKPLTEGQAGKALDGQSTLSIDRLVNSVASIELGHFKEQEVRKIFASILLKLIYDYRTKERSQALRHVTIIEEARNIVPARRPDAPPSIGERMVAELRKFGEGLIIISQFPIQISHEILRNAAIRIFHRIGDEENSRVAQGALNLTPEQARHLHNLLPGEAIVKVPTVLHAFPIYVEPESGALASVPDDHLANLMRERFYGSLVELHPKPLRPRVEARLQLLIHGLLKEGPITLEELRDSLPEYDFHEEIVPALARMEARGVLRRVEKDGKLAYELALPSFEL